MSLISSGFNNNHNCRDKGTIYIYNTKKSNSVKRPAFKASALKATDKT